LAAEGGTYAAWKNGPSKDPGYFPIAVWLQDPKNAPKYKALGINVYVALWRGPNEQQIAELKKHGMSLVCGQNRWALEHLDEPIIIGWMHGDEPDNAQSLPGGKGYGPPIPPQKIVEDYRRIQAKDPTRPVMLNLGQGVAYDGYIGRGVRKQHPEDYPEYIRGGDIISFDIYPAVHDRPEIAGKLWYVPYGVQRLGQWANGQKVIWNCIECTRISNPNTKPTPAQVKAEVWMSIIHGSRGLIYFCHQFKPNFIEAGLLADTEMAKAVGAINRQIHELAPAINSPSVPDAVKVEALPAEVSQERVKMLPGGPIAFAVKRQGGATYLFAVRMEANPAKVTFQLSGVTGKAVAEVLGEDRRIEVKEGRFSDEFGPYAVHLYRW
jgi:hypothetical protein